MTGENVASSDDAAYQAHATAPATIEEWREGGLALRLAFMAGVRHGRGSRSDPVENNESWSGMSAARFCLGLLVGLAFAALIVEAAMFYAVR